MLNYEKVVSPFLDKRTENFDAFLTELCKGGNYNGVRNPEAEQQIVRKLASIFTDFEKFSSDKMAKSAQANGLKQVYKKSIITNDIKIEESFLRENSYRIRE